MARRIIAFIDVLGFKALAEHVPHHQLTEIYRELQLAAQLHTTIPVFPEDQRRFDSDAYYEDHEITRQNVVNVVMASDSIVVYSAGDAYTDALAVGSAVRGLLVAAFRNGIALRGALAIGELDEINLDGDRPNGRWTTRFAGLVGLGLIHAYELEGRCNWSGAILHPGLVAHLDALVLSEHEDGNFTALDLCCATQLVLETKAPVKDRDSGNTLHLGHELHWAIHWPVLTNSLELSISESQVAASFTSFDRTGSNDVIAKRDETLAFMRRASADSVATSERRRQSRQTDADRIGH